MSNSNRNRLDDPNLDADLSRLGDADRNDPSPARIGGAPAPDAAETPDSLPSGETSPNETGSGSGTAGRSSVEGVDEAAAERDAIRDSTS